MTEVFDPKDGRPIITVRWAWLARFITAVIRRWDYAAPGEGW